MPKKEFLEIVKEIKEHDKEIDMTPRELLRYFSFEKRTKGNQAKINKCLDNNQLETDPEYTIGWVDGKIILKHKKKAKNKKETEPIQRINILDSANNPPVTISRNSTLKEAVTLMMMHNFSQLPVISSPRSVVGVVTWESIGYAMTSGCHSPDLSGYICVDVTILDYETPLLDAIRTIIDKEFVIVQKQDKTMCGIVTIADISSQFLIMTEPFLLLEQIENNVRRLLDGKFLLAELKAFFRTGDIKKDVEHIDDLNFGDYIRLIEKPDHWEKLKLPLERSHFIQQLHTIREIRNDIMHFDPEGITKKQKEDLLKMSRFLMELRKRNL